MQLSIRLAAVLVLCFLDAGSALAQGPSASGQAYPSRPVRLLVPTVPGGGLDVIARVIAPPLTESRLSTVSKCPAEQHSCEAGSNVEL